MEVLKVNGWHQDDRFFEVQLTHETYLDDEDIRGIASIFNCAEYAKDFLGCAFTTKFVLKTTGGVWVHPCLYHNDQEISVDDAFILLEEVEYLELIA